MNKQLNTHTVRNLRMEQGQALVLIALAIVGLMGFAALAVDLGRVYAERRRAQNAVDAAALSWAYAQSQIPYGGAYTEAQVGAALPAYTSLFENDYQDTDHVQIFLENPPTSGPYGPASGLDEETRLQYFRILVNSRVDQIFSQFVFSGSQNITVEAVARAIPTTSISPGNALMASGKTQCPGIIFNGGATTSVHGGNIFSNSDANATGSCYSGVTTGSSGSITVEDGDVLVAGGWSGNPGYTVDPPYQQGVDQQELPDVPLPDCSHLSNRSQPSDSSTPMHEGIYSDITIHNGAWTMEPGMYCLNGDFTVNGGSLNGDGVIIVMNHGSVSLGGNADVSLKRPNDYVDGANRHWGGMLIYMPENNHGGVDLSGNNGTSYMGTIYAPGPRTPISQEKCNIGGANTSIGVSAAVICSTVGVAGNSDVTIFYEEEENYRMPPTVELTQ